KRKGLVSRPDGGHLPTDVCAVVAAFESVDAERHLHRSFRLKQRTLNGNSEDPFFLYDLVKFIDHSDVYLEAVDGLSSLIVNGPLYEHRDRAESIRRFDRVAVSGDDEVSGQCLEF